MGRDVLGGFEHQILLSILRLGDDTYTVPIVLELESQRVARPHPRLCTSRCDG